MSPAALSARRIGEILCEKGLLTTEQLEEALEEQEQTDRRFGEILLERGLVSRLALASALAEQWATLEGEHATVQSTAAEEGEQVETLEAIEEEWQALRGHRPIGEIFVAGGLISQEQLDRALEEQKRSGQRLGEVLVAHGAVSRLELASALAEQWAARPRLRLASDPPAATAAPAAASNSAPTAQAASIANQRIEELAGRLEQRDESFLEAAQELESRIAGLEQLIAAGRDSESTGSELDELRRTLAELRERELDVTGIGHDELESALEARIGPLDERLASFGEAAEQLGADLRGAVERLGIRLDHEAHRLEDVASRHAREAAEGRLAEEAAARAEIEAAVAARITALEELTALSGEDRRIVELASDLADLRSAVHALTDREPTASTFDPTPFEERIGALEDRLTHQREADEAREHAAASGLEQLRDRIDEEARRLEALSGRQVDEAREAARTAAAALEERLAELQQRLGASEDGRVEGLTAELAELRSAVHALTEREQSAQADASEQLEDRLAGLEARLAQLSQAEQALDGSLAEALEEIQGKLHEEGRRLEQLASEHADAAVEPRLAELEQRVAASSEEDPRIVALAADVAQLRSELGSLSEHEPSNDEVLARLDKLEEESRKLDELATEHADAAIEPRLAELEQRVAASSEENPRIVALAADVAQLRSELGSLSEREPSDEEARSRLDELEARLNQVHEAEQALDGSLGAALDGLRARVDELATEHTAAALEARLAEIEQQIGAGRADDQRIVELGQDLTHLRGELQTLQKEISEDEALERLDELEAKLTQLREAEEALDGSLGSALEQLSDKVEAESRRLEELATERLGAALEVRLAELEQRVSAGDDDGRIDAFGAELADLRGSLEALAARDTSAEATLPLEQRIEDLADGLTKLTEGQEAHDGSLTAALDELRTQVDEESQRLEKLGAEHVREAVSAERKASLAAASSLAARIAKVEQHVAARASGSEVEKLASEVGELRRALDQQREDGVKPDELEARLAELEARTHAVAEDFRGELEALRADHERALQEAFTGQESRFAELDQRAGESRSDAELLSAELTDVRQALAELHGRDDAVSERLEERAAQLEQRLSRIDEVEEGLRAELQALVDDRAGALGKRLGKVEKTLSAAAAQVEERVAEVENRREQAHEDLATAFESRIGELETRLGKADEKIADEAGSALETLRLELHRSEERVEALRAEHERALRDVAAELESSVDGLAQLSADRDQALRARIEGALEERFAELQAKLAELAGAEDRIRGNLQTALERAIGHLGARLGESEQMLAATAEQVESGLAELGARQTAAHDALAAAFDTRVVELVDRLEELAQADQGIVADIQSALDSRLGRLARRILESEQTLATSAEQIQSRVEVLEEGLGSADSSIARIDDLSVAAAGLQRTVDDLGERVDGQVAGALAALAGWQPRASVSETPNGTSESRADQPVAAELPAATPPGTGFVAFVPTGKGYKLVEYESAPPPSLGAEVDLPGVSGPMIVAKLGASPLSDDTRPCAYLEVSPSTSPLGVDNAAPSR